MPFTLFTSLKLIKIDYYIYIILSILIMIENSSLYGGIAESSTQVDGFFYKY